MIWLSALALAVAVAAVAVLQSRRRLRALTPRSLAHRVFRQPERCLVDVPLYLSKIAASQRPDFLLEVDRSLAAMGPLSARRDFVRSLAAAIGEPSRETIEAMAGSLVNSPPGFREAVAWRGVAEPGLDYFRALHVLSRQEDPRGIRKSLGGLFRKKKRRRRGASTDSEVEMVVSQWRALLEDLLAVVDSASKVHSVEPSSRSRKSGQSRGDSSLAFQKAFDNLREAGATPLLEPFRALAVQACQPLRRSIDERRNKKAD